MKLNFSQWRSKPVKIIDFIDNKTTNGLFSKTNITLKVMHLHNLFDPTYASIEMRIYNKP